MIFKHSTDIMSNIYTLKIVKNGVTIQRKQIATGLGKGVKPLTLKADADLTYVVQDESGAKSLAKIKTHFVGHDLHVVIDGDDALSTHLVLQNYSDVQNSSALATTGKNGELVIFKADASADLSAGGDAWTTWVAPGIDDGSQLSFSSPAVWAGGALLLAAVSHGSSSASSAASTTALAKINSFINAPSTAVVSNPVLKDYQDAGITGVLDNAMAAAVSSLLKAQGTATVESAQSVVNAYLKVWTKANGAAADDTTNDPTSADYLILGLNPLSTDKGILLLNDVVKTRLSSEVDTLAKLNALASVANKIMLAAADNTVALVATEFNLIGLADISASNASAFTSAIAASPNDGSGVSSVAQLKAISAAYLKILAQADGIKANTLDASKLASSDDYKTIGAVIGKAGDSANVQSASALNLLNDVVDGLANTAVDTVKKINDLAAIVDKVMGLSTATSTPLGAAVGLKPSDLSALGVAGVSADNLAQVVEAIRLTQSANGSAVDTVKELQAAADLGVVMAYADTAPGTAAHVSPTLSNYLNAGLLSLDTAGRKAVTVTNLAAINSAVEALASADVNSTSKLQAVVDAYSKVLAEADGTKANTADANRLTVADVRALGALSAYDSTSGAIGAIGGGTTAKALGTGAQQGSALKLFNEVIDGRTNSQVNTVAELNQLNIVVDKILDASNGITLAAPLTAVDFGTIGISGVVSGNLAKVVSNIAATRLDATHGADGTLVDTLSELQSIASLAVVQTFSNDPTNSSLTTPSAITYSADLGFTDITNNFNLAIAVNSVLSAKRDGNISLSAVHNFALDFQSILNEATSGVVNSNPNPTAAQYEDVLLNIGHVLHNGVLNTTTDIHSNALALLNDVVAHKSASSVNTLAQVDAIATVVDHIMNKAVDASGNGASNVTFAELSSLGLTTNGWSDASYPNKAIALNNAIRLTDDTGVGVHTWDQLQAILNSSVVFQA